MILLGTYEHAHKCPVCKKFYICTTCELERDMMKPKYCDKHRPADTERMGL